MVRNVMKEVVDDIERVRGVMDYAKAVCTAFGTIGLGTMIAFFPPQSLRDEIPIHTELGMGFMGFGALFVLALFFNSGPGSIGQRAKSLLLAVIAATFALAAALSGLGPQGLVGIGVAVGVGLFSLLAFWEVVSGRPSVTNDP